MQLSENRKNSWVPFVILIPITLPILIMYLWLLLSSVSTGMNGLIPKGFTLSNWSVLWQAIPGKASIWAYFFNTVLFAFFVAIFEVLIAAAAAYAIARLNFPGRRIFLSLTIVLHAFPAITLIIALFYILRMLGLYDTLVGVVLVKLALGIPFSIWILKGFFDNVPWDIEIAAMVDGSSRFNIWRKIMIPMVGPGLAAVAIFTFLSSWSEFMIVYIFAPNSNNQTLSILLNMLSGDPDRIQLGLIVAIAVFYIAPVLLFYFVTQKYLMNMYGGGVKG